MSKHFDAWKADDAAHKESSDELVSADQPGKGQTGGEARLSQPPIAEELNEAAHDGEEKAGGEAPALPMRESRGEARLSQPPIAEEIDELEELDEPEITDLPPTLPGHYLLLRLGQAKQRVLDTARAASRASLRDIAQIDDEGREAEGTAQAEENTFELEMSDLPPTKRSHFLLLRLSRPRATVSDTRRAAPLMPRQRRRSVGRALTMFGVCLVLLVLLFGNVPGLRALLPGIFAPTPTPATQSSFSQVGILINQPIIVHHFGTPQPSVPGSPGPLPATCPRISTLQYFTTPLDPPGLGGSPLWLSGFTGPSAALDNLTPIDAQVAHASWPDGWYETLAVFIQKGYNGDITLRGSGQGSGAPVWLSRSDPQILGNSLTLNLNDGSHYIQDGQWQMASISIAVPEAGCYSLQASWGNNSWTRFFAAGTE